MVTIPDPSDTLGDPVVEQTVQRLIETAGRLVAGRSAPGSGVTAPHGTIDDTGRVEFSQETMRRTGTDTTMRTTKTTSNGPDRKTSKKKSRVLHVHKNKQVKNNFTGVLDTEIRAGFNRSIWSPAVNMEQLPLGRSQLIVGDSLVRVLQNLRTSWITKVMVFGGAR